VDIAWVRGRFVGLESDRDVVLALRLVAEPNAAGHDGERVGVVDGEVFVTDTGLSVVFGIGADGRAVLLFVTACGHASGAVGEVETIFHTVRVVDGSIRRELARDSTERSGDFTSLLYP